MAPPGLWWRSPRSASAASRSHPRPHLPDVPDAVEHAFGKTVMPEDREHCSGRVRRRAVWRQPHVRRIARPHQRLRAVPAGPADDNGRMPALGDSLADNRQAAAHLPGIGPVADMVDCGGGPGMEFREEVAVNARNARPAPHSRPGPEEHAPLAGPPSDGWVAPTSGSGGAARTGKPGPAHCCGVPGHGGQARPEIQDHGSGGSRCRWMSDTGVRLSS